MAILAYSYTNLLQFCHGVVKLNRISNAMLGINKSIIVTGFHCFRRQDMSTLLIPIISKVTQAVEFKGISLCRCFELHFLSQKALRIHRL